MQTIRYEINDPVPGATAARTDQRQSTLRPITKRKISAAMESPRQRTPEQTVHRYLLGVRRNTQPVRAAATLQSNHRSHCRPAKLRPIELARLARVGQCRDGGHRHECLGIEISLRFLATGYCDPRIRSRHRADRRRRWQRCHSWRSHLHAVRRAGQQFGRTELYSALPCLSFGPRRIRRRDFRNASVASTELITSASPSSPMNSTA